MSGLELLIEPVHRLAAYQDFFTVCIAVLSLSDGSLTLSIHSGY